MEEISDESKLVQTHEYTLSNPIYTDILNYNYKNNDIFYEIQITYKTEKWQIKKSFKEIQSFIESLHGLKYQFLPKLAPISESNIKDTNKSVQDFLKYLNYRFDILSNSITSVFFQFNNTLNLIAEIEKENLNQIYNFQLKELNGMTLNDFIYDFDCGLLIIGLEDVSLISALGRFWSLIEYEVLGSLVIYQRLFDKERRPYFRKLISKNFDARVTKLNLSRDKKKFFLGLDNGSLMTFNINKIDRSKYGGEVNDDEESNLVVVSEGSIFRYLADRITGITNNAELLFLIGKENKLIVVNVCNNELIFSGSIKKRIEGKGYPCDLEYDQKSNKLFITTITNIILVYTFTSSTKFTESVAKSEFKVEYVMEIICESSIKAVFISNANLMIGLETKAQFFIFNNKTNAVESNVIPFDGTLNSEISNSSKYLALKYFANSVSSICYFSALKLIILGLSDGCLMVFSSKSFEIIFAKKISTKSIVKLILLEENEIVLSGDEGGNICFFKFG